MSYNDTMIRNIMVNCYTKVQYLKLTKEEYQLVNLMKKEDSLNSSKLKTIRKISVQTASSMLNRLWRKGYFTRIKLKGDIYYKYYMSDKINL